MSYSYISPHSLNFQRFLLSVKLLLTLLFYFNQTSGDFLFNHHSSVVVVVVVFSHCLIFILDFIAYIFNKIFANTLKSMSLFLSHLASKIQLKPTNYLLHAYIALLSTAGERNAIYLEGMISTT